MVNGTQNVLEAAVRHRSRRCWPRRAPRCTASRATCRWTKAHPFNNRTLYGGLKIANEQILRSYNDMYGLHYVVLRPFNVYGPRMDVFGVYTEVMIRWLERLASGEAPIIFGDGNQTMDFVYVKDVAEAYVCAGDERCNRRRVQRRLGHRDEPARPLPAALRERPADRESEPVLEPPRKVNPVTRRRAAVAAGQGPHRLRDRGSTCADGLAPASSSGIRR